MDAMEKRIPVSRPRAPPRFLWSTSQRDIAGGIVLSRSESNQRTDKRWNWHRIQKHLVDFCSNTTIHGLRYLTEEHRPWHERVLWLLGIVMSVAACVLLVQQTWGRWASSPVIVAMDERMRPVWEIPFPAITICPLTRINQSHFNITAAIKSLDDKTLSNESMNILFDLLLQCEAPFKRQKRILTTDLPIQRIEKAAVALNETVISVVFRGTEYSAEKVFSPLLTASGLCYTFNMLPRDSIFPENTFSGASIDYLVYTDVSVLWSLDGGYKSKAGIHAYPYRAMGTGRDAGMKLKLRILPINNERFCTESQGFEVVLHNPAQMPRIQQHAFVVPLSVSTHVAITAQDIVTAEELRSRYSPEQRQCYFQEERQLRYFKQYTQQNCELECITNITAALCGCVSFYMPRKEGARICDGGNRLCIKEARLLFQLMESDIQSEEYTKKRETLQETLGDNCHCLQSCMHVAYTTERSQTSGEFNRFYKLRSDGSRGTKEDYIDGDIAELLIYYKESHFIPTRRMELYGIVNFIANCGGVLGLCLGVSVLSVIEVVYWLLVRPCWRNKRTRVSSQPQTLQTLTSKWRSPPFFQDSFIH